MIIENGSFKKYFFQQEIKFNEWACPDLNRGPFGYQPNALTRLRHMPNK